MAVFENLHDAGVALAGYLRRNLTPSLSDVMAAPPIENATGAAEAVRVSLMWVTPQPTHRNDPWVTGADGQETAPPVSLSAFYLVTAYGSTDSGEPGQAINRLGQALQIFETGSVLDLPLPDDPGTPELDPTPGTGQMTIVHVPTAADLMEKIYTPLQMRLRPWALFEVGPIQLARLTAPRPGPDIVRPGGVRLAGVAPVAPPRILHAVPARIRAGGRLMLVTAEAGNAVSLRVGGVEFTFADTPAGPLEIARPDSAGRVFATYPAAEPAGDFDAVLRGAVAGSDPEPVTVLDATASGVDAPIAALSLGGDLVLSGSGLGTTDRVFIWPDAGIRDPAEVLDLPPDAVAAGSVTVLGATLAGGGLRAIPYRVSLRLGSGAFTPYVLLQVTP